MGAYSVYYVLNLPPEPHTSWEMLGHSDNAVWLQITTTECYNETPTFYLNAVAWQSWFEIQPQSCLNNGSSFVLYDLEPLTRYVTQVYLDDELHGPFIFQTKVSLPRLPSLEPNRFAVLGDTRPVLLPLLS